MLPHSLRFTGQSHPTRLPAPNVTGAEAKKHFPKVYARLKKQNNIGVFVNIHICLMVVIYKTF